MIKKALCAILVLCMLLSSLGVTGIASTPAGGGGATGGGGGGTGTTGSTGNTTPDVTMVVTLSDELKTVNKGGTHENLIQVDISIEGLDVDEKINAINTYKLSFDGTKAHVLAPARQNGKPFLVVEQPNGSILTTSTGFDNTENSPWVSLNHMTSGGDYLEVTENDTSMQLATVYIQVTDQDIIDGKAPLDITIDTSAFYVKGLENKAVKYEYTWAFEPSELSFDLRPELTGVSASDKVVTYDGTVENIEPTGTEQTDIITYTCDGEEFTGAKDAGTYEVTAKVQREGYKPFAVTKTLTINKATLTANVVAMNRTYNGTTEVELTGSLSGVVLGDDVDLATLPKGTMEDGNVGEDKNITVPELTLTGDDASNYILTQPTGVKVNITPALLNITAKSQEIKTTDSVPTGTALYNFDTNQLYGSDTLSGEAEITGITYPLSAGTYVINKGTLFAGNNYEINFTTGNLIVKDKDEQTSTGTSLNDSEPFVYGTPRDFTLTLAEGIPHSAVSVVSDITDVATVSYNNNGVITVTPVNVGNTDIIITVAETETYQEWTFISNVSVTEKTLTYTIIPDEKVYDGTDEFTATATIDGVVEGDDVSAVCRAGSLEAWIAGPTSGKLMLSLTGTDAGNYVFAEENFAEIRVGDIAVTILPKEITAEVTETVNRFYDGTLDFVATAIPVGVVGDDDVTVDAEGTLASKNAGIHTDATVTVALNGVDCNNYVLANNVINNVQVEIYKREITATVVAEDKEYDGKEEFNAIATLHGVLGEDEVETSVNAHVYSKNVGTYIDGEATVTLIAGLDNYVLAQSEFDGLVVTISPKELTVSGLKATDKVYDETTVVALTGGELVGVVENDNVTAVMPVEGTVADANIGSNKAVTVPVITLEGDDAGNYILTQPSNITVNISAPASAPTYRPSYTTGGGGGVSTPVTPDKDDTSKEDVKDTEEKDDATKEDETKEDETKPEAPSTDYAKATATVSLKENASEIRFVSTDEDGKFNPDAEATRNEVVNALNEVLSIVDPTGDCELSDIEGGENAAIVELFTKANIIAGYEDGTFRGEGSITRAEFVKILTVALGLEIKEHEENKVNDIEGHWAQHYVNSFVELGYILGYPDGSFKPDASISKAEVVIIVNRVIGKDIENTDNSDVTITDMDDSHWAYEYVMSSVK